MTRILVVDDDPDIQAFIGHDLKKSGYEVHSAFTTEEAIVLLGEHCFDFALVDIFMGKNESSNQVIHFIKQDLAGENKNLPMAIMSASMNESMARKFFLKGPTVFETIKKPLKSGQINELIKGNETPRVLAVDDDPDILSLIKRELIKGGYNVFGALDNQQAKKLLQSTSFVAAIVDNKLGVDQDSKELSNYLESLPSSDQVPLILTGKKINEDVKNNDQLLVFETIQKPFARGAFLEAVDKIRLWAKQSQNQEGFTEVISGVTDNIEEEHTVVRGSGEEEEEVQVVSGDDSEEEEAQVVSGSEREDSTKVTVSGSDQEDGNQVVSGTVEEDESSQTIKGEKEDLTEESTMVHGEREDIDEELWAVKKLHEKNNEGPNQRDKKGVTPVMAYCYTGDIEKINSLIEEGANLSLRARNGKTCLHYAAYSKNIDLVKMLVEDHHLKINERDEQKREPLYDAMKANDAQMVKALIDLGARTSSKYDGRNYLTLAVLMKSPEIAKVLYAHGLSPKEKDYNGKSALDYAQKNNMTEMLTIFAEAKS